MRLSIPIRFADGVGNAPAAANWNDDNDWLTALVNGLLFVSNGGQEAWNNGTTFSNPVNGSVLSDTWTEVKSGTTPCTADVSREASVVDTGKYSMKVDITGAGSSDSYWAITQSNTSFISFGSQTMLAGVSVKCSTANKVRIKIFDGTTTAYSAYHTGDGTWQALQVKLTVQSVPTQMTITVEINPANFTGAVYLDSIYNYAVPSAISARSQAALAYSPLSDAPTNVKKAPTIQRFTSGSGTYTTPAGVLYIRVKMAGGGGGACGSGTSGGGTGGTGGATTFGATASAGPGTGGIFGSEVGGSGGTNTPDGTAIVNIAGTDGQPGGQPTSSAQVWIGGMGGATAFGGAGAGANSGSAGKSAMANSGGGGGGGGLAANSGVAGCGGGAGGYLDLLFASPLTTYAYAVGAAGSAGSAGTGGNAGGAGGSGVIIVEEYYQ